jgi:hypothetical protein
VLTGPYIERNSWGGIGLCSRKQDTRRNNLEHSLIAPTVGQRLKIDTTIIAHASPRGDHTAKTKSRPISRRRFLISRPRRRPARSCPELRRVNICAVYLSGTVAPASLPPACANARELVRANAAARAIVLSCMVSSTVSVERGKPRTHGNVHLAPPNSALLIANTRASFSEAHTRRRRDCCAVLAMVSQHA